MANKHRPIETISKAGIRKRAQRAASLAGKHCSDCDSTDSLERHHPDYSNQVVILCKACHHKRDEADGTARQQRRTMRPCAVCQTPFMPTHSTNRTCKSPECRATLGRLNANKRWHSGGTA